MALWTCVIGATFRHAIPLEAETHPPKFEITSSIYPSTVGVHIGGVVVVRRIVQCLLYLWQRGSKSWSLEKDAKPSWTPRKLFARPRPQTFEVGGPGLAYVTRQTETVQLSCSCSMPTTCSRTPQFSVYEQSFPSLLFLSRPSVYEATLFRFKRTAAAISFQMRPRQCLLSRPNVEMRQQSPKTFKT